MNAFPPAPDHTFYGLVRNEWGEPLNLSGAIVTLFSSNEIGAVTPVASSIQPGINYRLTVPMDSGLSLNPYPVKSSGLVKQQPFQIKVIIGGVPYLPIEIQTPRSLGDPSGITRLDLTLGVDSDGDGLPDAWEIANELDPNDPTDADKDSDGDKISNRDEYHAGTFAFDPKDGFHLELISVHQGIPTLEFLAILGRTYTIQASKNLQDWAPVRFQVLTDDLPGPIQNTYTATGMKKLKIQIPSESDTQYSYFKALVH